MAQANFSDDATGVVKAIQDGVRTEIIELGDEIFTTRPVYLPPQKTKTAAMEIGSLEGLVDYLKENVDSHNFSDLVVVVNSPRSVSVSAQVGSETDSRVCWLDADYEVDGFPFGRFMDHETFMVSAQALIVDQGDREKMLKYIGNLTSTQVSTSVDDGVSQTVVIEHGVRKSEVELPNPVKLAPRRTFPEVDQPSSPFVLRVKQAREGLMPEIALFEADGGLWKVDAISRIKTYIRKNLGEEINIPIIG